jgi:hypothetical protein
MKVKYLGATDEQVMWGSNDDPRLYLEIGQIYEVYNKEVHSWHTKLILANYTKLKFNSVSFEEI